MRFAPARGGRVSSLRCLQRGTEFLTSSQRHGPAAPASLDAQFRNGPCAGIEDCLPTVAACGAHTEGGPVPDHGDLWQLPWTVLEQTGSTSLHMEAHCFSRPLSVRKHMRVSGRVLRIDYQGPQHGRAADLAAVRSASTARHRSRRSHRPAQ